MRECAGGPEAPQRTTTPHRPDGKDQQRNGPKKRYCCCRGRVLPAVVNRALLMLSIVLLLLLYEKQTNTRQLNILFSKHYCTSKTTRHLGRTHTAFESLCLPVLLRWASSMMTIIIPAFGFLRAMCVLFLPIFIRLDEEARLLASSFSITSYSYIFFQFWLVLLFSVSCAHACAILPIGEVDEEPRPFASLPSDRER